MHARLRTPVQGHSEFAGFRLPPDVILLAVRWYLRYGLSSVWILRSPGASVSLPGEPLFRGGLSHYGVAV